MRGKRQNIRTGLTRGGLAGRPGLTHQFEKLAIVSLKRLVQPQSSQRPAGHPVVLRDKVIKPLLANRGRLRAWSKPRNRGPLDDLYEGVQRKMQEVFKAMKLAA